MHDKDNLINASFSFVFVFIYNTDFKNFKTSTLKSIQSEYQWSTATVGFIKTFRA